MAAAEESATVETFNPFTGNHMRPRQQTSQGAISIAGIDNGERSVRVRWSDGHESEFHYVWLRFNCFCRHCGTSDDGIRYFDLTMIPDDVRPDSIRVDDLGNLAIVWAGDGHVSEYGPDWLRAYCYSDRERARRHSFQPKPWKADLLDRLPRADYATAKQSEEARLGMYRHLLDYGLLMLDGVGDDPEETEKAASLFGPVHPTNNYGFIYDVQPQEVPEIGGHSAIHQNPHCDDTFQYVPPGIVMFHFIVNEEMEGGVSSYTDGFAVAEALREEEPEAFQLLSTVPVQFVRRHPDQFYIRGEGKVICLDDDGKLAGIRYFDRATAPLDADINIVEKMMWAQREFMKRVNGADFQVRMKLRGGSVVVVDNHRVMHGRTAFDQRSRRRLRTCMMDREECHGYWRDLAYRLGHEDYDLVLPMGALR